MLLRIDRPSELGGWSCEVGDTKLARETRAGSVLQLCLYSDLVGRIQGRLPEEYRTHKTPSHADGNGKVHANHVKVVTGDNVVYLMGPVTRAEADVATEVARITSGVTKVVRVFERTD